MVRTIVTPKNKDLHLIIPKEYIGKEIEVTYLAVDEIAPSGDEERKFWNALAVNAMENTYDENEPDYSNVPILEPNPAYNPWKKGQL